MSTDEDIRKAKGKIDARADLLIRGLTLEVLSRIVQRTPVDTGRAAGNWNVSQDEPDFSVEDAPSRQVPGEADVHAVRAGGETYIVNGVPYIEALEYGLYPNPPAAGTGKTAGGFSTQAPQGMVRVTVAEIQPLVEQIATALSRG